MNYSTLQCEKAREKKKKRGDTQSQNLIDIKNPHFRKLRERIVRSLYINKMKMPRKERETVTNELWTI